MTVYLVGAGPGDPGLITARGLELIRSCDILVHDRLVAEELIAEASEDTRVISREGLDQGAVNELLVNYGRAGFDVVRLKGGDPFVFGRGGEEALALEQAGIEIEIVPGISSIAAVPAAAGIPITHRGDLRPRHDRELPRRRRQRRRVRPSGRDRRHADPLHGARTRRARRRGPARRRLAAGRHLLPRSRAGRFRTRRS